MSEQTREPHDPLRALREADHRPVTVIWRERVFGALRSFAGIAAQPDRVDISGRLIGAVVGIALAFLGWQAFVASDPPVEASLPFASPTATLPVAGTARVSGELDPATDGSIVSDVERAQTELVVHVAGAVGLPGLVVGYEGWRVNDAIDAAGGLQPSADVDRLNLAAYVQDGQRLYVPEVGQIELPSVMSGGSADGAVGEMVTSPIDINRADQATLEGLPGIGPVTADAIVQHREAHGLFANVEALVAVRGIGPATLDGLRDHATAG